MSIARRETPFGTRHLKLASAVVLFYFFVITLSIVFSEKPDEIAHFMSRDLHFLLAPFIFFAFHKLNINLRSMLYGVKVGLVVLCPYIIFQLDNGVIRPSGVMNNEVFGHLNVILTFIAVINLKVESFRDRVFSLLAFSAGTYIMLLNETRGAWIVYCILIIVSIYYLYRSKVFSSRVVSLIAISFVLLVALALNTGSVKERVNIATTQAQEWMAGEKYIDSSVGLRLEMWSAGIRSIENAPLFGYGNHNANLVAANYSDDRVKSHIASLNHLHNDYLNHFISKGFLGFLSVVGLLLLPLFVARSGPEIGYLIGVTLSVSYSIFALFNVVFGDVFMNAFYVFFVSIIIALKKDKNIKKV